MHKSKKIKQKRIGKLISQTVIMAHNVISKSTAQPTPNHYETYGSFYVELSTPYFWYS